MKQRIFNLLYITIIAFAVVSLASCDKTGGFQDPSFSRMFMPNSALKATTDATSATLSWGTSLYNDTAANKIYYVLQIATDAAFTNIVRTDTTTALSKKYTDADLLVKKDYYAQVKVRGVNGAGDSQWLKGNKFSILGENLFIAPLAGDIQYYTAILRWRHQDGLTKVTITVNGASADSLISADTLLLKKLTPNTTYTAELFKGATSKGTMTFTTKDAGMFTKIIDPTANLITEINGALDGAVLGLTDGTYDCGGLNPTLLLKNITIASVTGDPTKTLIVNTKEIILKGNGAGLTISGVTFDGTTNNGWVGASYFVVLNGQVNTGDATTFKQFTADNCIINLKSGATTFLRGSYGTAANDHKIGNIKINNCVANVGVTGSQNYGGIMCDKLQFDSVIITKSTLYNIARGIIGYTAKMNARSGTSVTIPVVKIDQCTFNSFGQQAKAAVFDGNTDVANQVNFFLTNSIMANTPDALAATTVNANAFVGYASNVYTLTNNFVYNCMTAASGGTAIIWPGTAPTTVTLPWTTSTTNFALPASVPNNGDPRWYH
ncbi:hypothetical protein [Pinibacter soli]|uniref:DUF4957 domain-containing protein n=1 Tax=Pinibacter soli TaxID=3044211 RepID=A0ABT6REX4_9BACT|nr:hypothetical protein [Pinibacter soli]MDI3321123.1 hypothetical protein [Pinibacter soli]